LFTARDILGRRP